MLSKDILILTFLNRKRMIHWRRWHPHPHNCGESWIAPLITTGVIPVTSHPWPVVPFFSPTMLIPLPFSILYQRKPIKKEIIQWHAIIAMNFIAYKRVRSYRKHTKFLSDFCSIWTYTRMWQKDYMRYNAFDLPPPPLKKTRGQ